MSNDDDGDGDGSGHKTRTDSRDPEVGVLSPRWMHEFRERSVAASAIGGFVGQLLGKFLPSTRAGGVEDPRVYWDRDELCIATQGGVTVRVDRRHAVRVADVVREGTSWYHLGASDDDLPINQQERTGTP